MFVFCFCILDLGGTAGGSASTGGMPGFDPGHTDSQRCIGGFDIADTARTHNSIWGFCTLYTASTVSISAYSTAHTASTRSTKDSQILSVKHVGLPPYVIKARSFLRYVIGPGGRRNYLLPRSLLTNPIHLYRKPLHLRDQLFTVHGLQLFLTAVQTLFRYPYRSSNPPTLYFCTCQVGAGCQMGYMVRVGPKG